MWPGVTRAEKGNARRRWPDTTRRESLSLCAVLPPLAFGPLNLTLSPSYHHSAWALKQVYEYLGNPPSLDHWSNDTDAKPCGGGKRWAGVSCSKGRVTELDLRGRGLDGTLAPGLAAAGALKKLNLSGNALAGELPSAWGSAGGFEALTSVSLADNKLGGDLPALWAARGALPGLYLLDLSGNNLTGTLPEAWGAPGVFPRLSVLGLRANALAGGLPAQWALNGSLPSLEVLVLDGNRLDGELPAEWGGATSGLARLKLLSAASNGLTGPLPESWGAPEALPALQVLNLANNSLAGALPAAWASRGAFRAARGPGGGVVLAPGNAGLNGTLPAGSPLKVLKSLGGGRVERCGVLPGCEAPPAELAKGGEVTGSGPQTLTTTLVVKGDAAGVGAWSDGAKAALADAVTKAVGKDAVGPATVTAVSDLAASVARPDVEVAPTTAPAPAPSPPSRRLLAATNPLAGSQAVITLDTPDADSAKRAVKALRGAVRDGSLLKAVQGAGLSGATGLSLDGEGVIDSSVDGGAIGSSEKRLSGGAVAGIVIGTLLGLGLLAALGWWLWSRGVFDRCRERCALHRRRAVGGGRGGGDDAAKAEAGTAAAPPKGKAAAVAEEKTDVPYTEYRKQRLEGAASGKKGRA